MASALAGVLGANAMNL
nr:hypothetical protein [uncultured Bacteroides sp.]